MVIGIFEIMIIFNLIDFGDIFVMLLYECIFMLENNGIGDFEVIGWSNSNSDYSFDIMFFFIVFVQLSMIIMVMLLFFGLGIINSLLSFEINVGSYDYDLLVNGVFVLVVLVDLILICVMFLEGEMIIELVIIINSGGLFLIYEWGVDGSILVWMYGVDIFQEGQVVFDILVQYLLDMEVIIYGGDDFIELQSLLNQVRVLIMLELEFGFGVVFFNVVFVIQIFINGGGGFIQILGGVGDLINSVGVFSGVSSVGFFFNLFLVLDELYLLMDNVIMLFEVLNYIQFFNFILFNCIDVLVLIDEENVVLSV